MSARERVGGASGTARGGQRERRGANGERAQQRDRHPRHELALAYVVCLDVVHRPGEQPIERATV